MLIKIVNDCQGQQCLPVVKIVVSTNDLWDHISDLLFCAMFMQHKQLCLDMTRFLYDSHGQQENSMIVIVTRNLLWTRHSTIVITNSDLLWLSYSILVITSSDLLSLKQSKLVIHNRSLSRPWWSKTVVTKKWLVVNKIFYDCHNQQGIFRNSTIVIQHSRPWWSKTVHIIRNGLLWTRYYMIVINSSDRPVITSCNQNILWKSHPIATCCDQDIPWLSWSILTSFDQDIPWYS